MKLKIYDIWLKFTGLNFKNKQVIISQHVGNVKTLRVLSVNASLHTIKYTKHKKNS